MKKIDKRMEFLTIPFCMARQCPKQPCPHEAGFVFAPSLGGNGRVRIMFIQPHVAESLAEPLYADIEPAQATELVKFLQAVIRNRR